MALMALRLQLVATLLYVASHELMIAVPRMVNQHIAKYKLHGVAISKFER